MNDEFFTAFLDQKLTSKEQIHRFIGEFANPDAAAELVSLLQRRETVGNTMIAEHVILPHLESPKVKRSQILVIRLADPIDFDDTTREIQLIVTILLKSEEEQATKQKIAQFTRRLADEDFLTELLTNQSKKTIYQLL
ncbi:PTS sugar transporter subunit IIA [Enterococcus hermanniensis]|uniref:PTS sugar transporter subunit IIA n=1 Tax=Enterococcus hermanniensis TaxID=249189 RepID=UPI001FE9374C|nr:PTS sugar transporter subunit IIA [Enterococcus hermanniensis]